MAKYGLWEELLMAADLYANKCTRQEEKFDYYRRSGVPWTWADCQAAHEMLTTLPQYWQLMDTWRRLRCFPPDHWTP